MQAEARATDATITVVIVEDHVVVREGTRELFGREGDITVVGEASTVAEAVNLARQLVPTLMVVDIELPDQSGVEVVREVVATGLPVRCLMLSAHDDYVYVSEALAAGAAGYLLKTVSAVELVAAVRAVATGAVVVDESLSRRLAGRLRQPEQTPAASLTSRELERRPGTCAWVLEQGDRRRARRRAADGRELRVERARQARSALAHRCHRVRHRAWPRLAQVLGVTGHARTPRIPLREILGRVFHPPLHDRAFWAVQTMVVVLACVHLVVDLHSSLAPAPFPTGVPIDLLLVPVGYAALRYGLSGSAATAVWAVLLWLPDFALSDDRGHPYADLVDLAIVVAVALFVGVEIERTHLERARAEAAEVDRHAAEVHYHQLFDTNASPILLVDPEGVVAEANPAAVALWGAAIGSGTKALLGLGSENLVEGRSPQTLRLEPEIGEERAYRLSVSRLKAAGGGSLRQVVLEDVTAEHLAETEARTWASEVLRAQEEERRRIAREIHDDPLQRLVQVARRMETLGSPAYSAEEAGRLGAARRELLDVVARLRDVTRGLRPPGLEQLGLVAAALAYSSTSRTRKASQLSSR